jgi:hypothetical protein
VPMVEDGPPVGAGRRGLPAASDRLTRSCRATVPDAAGEQLSSGAASSPARDVPLASPTAHPCPAAQPIWAAIG